MVNALIVEGLEKQLHDGEVNHCLSFEQVSDEISVFNTDLYYQKSDYLECCYREGRILE